MRGRLARLLRLWVRDQMPPPDPVPPVAAWNVKVLGSHMARQLFAARRAGPQADIPAMPVAIGLGGRVCCQADIEAAWLRHWCGVLRCVPLYHRKVWEDCLVLQTLWEAGMLAPGRSGLGFAVGVESLPSIFAARGVNVLATDLLSSDAGAGAWLNTGQHAAGTKERLFRPDILDRAVFDRMVRFQPVDMRAIPDSLKQGQFDFIWSVCSLEHLGSIAAGMAFVRESLRCLRPGGIAVHTTEFDMDGSAPPFDDPITALFQRQHLEAMVEAARQAGHHPLPIDFSPGEGVLDHFVDVPPYPADTPPVPFKVMHETPHLRLLLGTRTVTSVALVIRAGG